MIDQRAEFAAKSEELSPRSEPRALRNFYAARAAGEHGLTQVVFQMARIDVFRRPAESGGGLVLSINWRGDLLQFVLDDTARKHLRAALDGPIEPVTSPGICYL